VPSATSALLKPTSVAGRAYPQLGFHILQAPCVSGGNVHSHLTDQASRTCGYASILLSSVMIGHCNTRAVATSNWSAGSRWKGCGNWVDSTTICGVRGRRDTPGPARGAFYPRPCFAIELQPSALRKFGDFPTGDDANAEHAIDAMFEKVAVLGLQSIRSSYPPDPNVGVQHDHRRASQSSPATGSNGSRKSRTESRRSPTAAAADPAFETTSTSTGWPGSKGRPFRTSSPCSPTVVSLQCASTPSV
jgi:hypothetical protein